MMINKYGFPVFVDEDLMVDTVTPVFNERASAASDGLKFERAKIIASEARARNFPPPCDCRECAAARNLPAVLRILAKWTPMDRAAS